MIAKRNEFNAKLDAGIHRRSIKPSRPFFYSENDMFLFTNSSRERIRRKGQINAKQRLLKNTIKKLPTLRAASQKVGVQSEATMVGMSLDRNGLERSTDIGRTVPRPIKPHCLATSAK